MIFSNGKQVMRRLSSGFMPFADRSELAGPQNRARVCLFRRSRHDLSHKGADAE